MQKPFTALSAILFYLFVLPFFYLVSVLPFPLLYLLSDFMCFVLFGIVGYRKDVVTQNLRNSFPEKSMVEIRAIRGRFFHYFCDLFLEVFKTLTISKKTMLRHCTINTRTSELFAKYAGENKSVILVMGHLGNWEWAGNTFSMLAQHKLYVIYHPLSNREYDKMTYNMRSRFGTRLIPMKQTFKEMLAIKNELTATAFIADQSPQPHNAYWTTFLNQDTAIFKGMDSISRKLDYPVIYMQVKKIKRGYYEIDAELLCERPALTAENELSELFTRKLESDIVAGPETWLWTHRRWKHKRPADK